MGVDGIGEIHVLSHTTDGSPPWADATTMSSRPQSNFAPPSTRLTIHDLRGKEKNFNLDINAFELHKYDGSMNAEFDEDTEAQRIYFEEMSSFLKKRLGASRVIIFNHTFRYRDPSRADDQCDLKHKNPAILPHVDYDLPSARLKVIQILGEEEGNKLMQKRFQLVNIWRPIGPNPIKNHPLTVCDYTSIDVENDVHTLEIRASIASVSGLTISRNAQDTQKWYYQSEMQSDEMFLMKMYDSNPNVAQYCFHTSFQNEYIPPSNDEQKSLEVRCLVIYD
ncbi:unnamed protein product [Rotaria sp. Silwood1]|nr:unnamed protein product [Rotaria sp. Silwood1]